MERRSAMRLARDFDLSPFTIRRLGYAGKIKEYRCGRAVRYDPDELSRWMEIQGKKNGLTTSEHGPRVPQKVSR